LFAKSKATVQTSACLKARKDMNNLIGMFHIMLLCKPHFLNFQLLVLGDNSSLANLISSAMH